MRYVGRHAADVFVNRLFIACRRTHRRGQVVHRFAERAVGGSRRFDVGRPSECIAIVADSFGVFESITCNRLRVLNAEGMTRVELFDDENSGGIWIVGEDLWEARLNSGGSR